jgi:glutamyl-tRNA synthetase
MYKDPTNFEETFMQKQWNDDSLVVVESYLEILKGIEDFTHDKLYESAKEYCEKNNIKLKNLAQLLRLMITGKSAGAGMFETMEVIGKDFVLPRIESFIKKKKAGVL